MVTGLRYADWTVTVPLTVEMLAVCVVARENITNLRFTAMASAFSMIVTGSAEGLVVATWERAG